MLLHEEIRPSKLSDVIGQSKAVAKLEFIGKRGFAGKSLWITGKSGQGKTTIARIVASMASMSYAIVEVDGSDIGLDFIRKWEKDIRCKPLGCDCHVLIVNEAHQLSSAAVSRFLTTMESDGFCGNGLLIFTTTSAGNRLFGDSFDSGPFGSRCIDISLSARDIAGPFADHCKTIGDSIGMRAPIESYRKLAKKCGSNMRDMITRIESGELLDVE